MKEENLCAGEKMEKEKVKRRRQREKTDGGDESLENGCSAGSGSAVTRLTRLNDKCTFYGSHDNRYCSAMPATRPHPPPPLPPLAIPNGTDSHRFNILQQQCLTQWGDIVALRS